MSPLIVKPQVGMDVCSVTRSGIGLSQGVVTQAGWKVNDIIQVGFIDKAKCILLRCAEGGDGFKLAFANTRTRTGGRLSPMSFIRNYLQTVVALPKKKLVPVFLRSDEWTVAIPLDRIEWEKQEFSKAGGNTVPREAIGVYELLGAGDAVLRVGEGRIRDRIAAHLTDPRFSPPTVKAFRYVRVDDEADGKTLEKMRIAQYEAETGVLPRFQEIRA